MDHDSVDRRLQRVERFLDAHADGWRDEKNWRRGGMQIRAGSSGGADGSAGLEVDHDKTQQDREALGITDDSRLQDGRVVNFSAPDRNPGVDDGKDAELRRNFRAGRGAVNDETAQQNERADLLAQLDGYRGKTNVPELTGEESNDDLRQILLQAQKDNPTGNAANEVALEAARSNPATEQALKTSLDPARQARAEAQQAQHRATEAGADTRMPVRPTGA